VVRWHSNWATTFIESLGLRPLDTGGLEMARWLEGAGLLVMGLARNGVANYDFTLGVSLPNNHH
jgi:predicted dinucleotide-binding enzyme